MLANLTPAQWYRTVQAEPVRMAIAKAVEEAVRVRILQELALVPMSAEESRDAEARLFDLMYPVALETAMQELMDSGMGGHPGVRMRVVKAPAQGCRSARYLVGVKAAEARSAGLGV